MIVCGGEALMDFTRQAGGGYAPHPGGSPYNVAVALARQDVPTAFLGQISRDLFGEQLLAHLQNSGVDTSLVSRSARPSTLAFADTLGQAEPQYASTRRERRTSNCFQRGCQTRQRPGSRTWDRSR